MMRLYICFILCVWFALNSCEQKKTEEVLVNPAELRTQFSQLLSDYYDGTMALDPIVATQIGDHRFNADFPDYLSKAYKDSSKAFFKRIKKTALGFEDEYLTDQDRLSKAVLLWECDIHLEELSYRKELFPINQLSTLNLTVAKYAGAESAQPFNTVEDYENWLNRMNGFVLWVEMAEKRMREGASLRFILPSALILKVVPQLKAMTNENIEEHLFYTPIKKLPKSFSDEDKQRLTDDYTAVISEKLIPAFEKLHAYVSTEYLEAGRNSSGIDALPNGKEFYNFRIKKMTSTDLTADEIHQIGLDEVARISSEMEKVKQEVGFEGSLPDFFEHIRNFSKFKPFKTPQQVIDNFNRIHKKMKPALKTMFFNEPKTKFIVKRTESFREASASAQYDLGSLEENRPGVFYVPIPDVSNYNTVRDEALFLHEAIPGHHYQIALTQENDSLPAFRRSLWYSAYGEGWALYSESLGTELGLYKDPYQYFGMLTAEMHRAIRLVVDTGLHSKGWTREQAIQYSLENEPLSKDKITSEIERYMAMPGQALSYKIGQMKILELRARAENELGEGFDIREFHEIILETGCIPLAILEGHVNKWIQSKQEGSNDNNL